MESHSLYSTYFYIHALEEKQPFFGHLVYQLGRKVNCTTKR